jgi:hypothetical protein
MARQDSGNRVEAEEGRLVKKPTLDNAVSVIPTTMDQLLKLTEIIAASDLAPAAFKGKPGNCFIAIQMGMEIGVSPMQAIQNIFVVGGRPAIYGDLGKALLLRRGCKIEMRELAEVKKTGEGWCRVTRPDKSSSAVGTFSMDDAKQAGLWGKDIWAKYPYRMLSWRAFWIAARDAASDYLRGMQGLEEVRDIVETTTVDPIPMPQRMSETDRPRTETTKTKPETKPLKDEGLPSTVTTTRAYDRKGNEILPPKKSETKAFPDDAWEGPMAAMTVHDCFKCADDIAVGDKMFRTPDGTYAHSAHYQTPE